MKMVLHIPRTLGKLLRQEGILKKIVKPVGIHQNASYSSNVENNEQPKETTDPPKNVQKQKFDIKKKKPWKLIPIFGFLTLSCFGAYLILILGSPERDIDGNPLKDDLTNSPIMRQYIIRTYREMKYYFTLICNPQKEKLLPDPLEAPYKQPKYTLVMELTDVLVHAEWTYSSGWKYKKRPLLDHFLDILKGSYEIVLYTAEQGRTVFSLMEAIDPNNIIAYKLVRGTTRFTGFNHVKELNHLNRDLKKVICIDWNASSVRSNPENLLKVKRWTGRDDDTSLLDLATFLKTIADNNIEDVRDVLVHYRKYNDPVEAFRKKQEMLIEELDKAAAKKADAPKPDSGFKLFS